MNLQAVADPVGGRRLMTNSLLRPQRYCSCFVIIIVFHPACSKESVDLIKHATQKLSSKLCDQIKAQQPYPQLHQGLIPYQTKLLFSFPLSLLKSPVIRSRLKVDDSSPPPSHPTPFPVGPSWIPKASASLSASGDQATPPIPVKRGSPLCSAAFAVISLAVDRSSEGSAVITGSLRWRQERGPLKKGTEAKKREMWASARWVLLVKRSWHFRWGRGFLCSICKPQVMHVWMQKHTHPLIQRV